MAQPPGFKVPSVFFPGRKGTLRSGAALVRTKGYGVRMRKTGMIRSIKAVTVAIAAASAFTIVMPAAAMAGTAKPATVLRPMTGEGCYSGTFTFGLGGEECTKVTGTGLKITSIEGNFTAGSSAETIYIEYYGPNGYITKTGNFALSEGETTGWHTWHNPNPNATMKSGYYCTEAYRSDGAPIISDCILVHT